MGSMPRGNYRLALDCYLVYSLNEGPFAVVATTWLWTTRGSPIHRWIELIIMIFRNFNLKFFAIIIMKNNNHVLKHVHCIVICLNNQVE